MSRLVFTFLVLNSWLLTGALSAPVEIKGGGEVLKGKPVKLEVEKPAGATDIRWYQIIPDVSKYYKNANHPWEDEPYKWVGFGEIDYERKEITRARGDWELDLFVPGEKKTLPLAPTETAAKYSRDLGTFWFEVEIVVGGKKIRSLGLSDRDKRGLSPKTCRVTVEDGEGYIGHLTGFFNVPGVFGSIPYQCGNYIGVDCADVLVAARNRWKEKPNKRDFNVAMLVNEWPQVAKFEIEDGEPEKKIQWGTDVKPGDLIAVRYAGKKRYQHIGALYQDADGDGELGAEDFVIHAGPHALHRIKLERGSFDGTVVILRPK